MTTDRRWVKLYYSKYVFGRGHPSNITDLILLIQAAGNSHHNKDLLKQVESTSTCVDTGMRSNNLFSSPRLSLRVCKSKLINISQSAWVFQTTDNEKTDKSTKKWLWDVGKIDEEKVEG